MKRDMDLIRIILLKIEERHKGTVIKNFQVEGYELSEVVYHCKLLYDGGFISAYKSENGGDILQLVAVGGLTWEGNDFLDKIRDNSIWFRTKETIKRKKLPLIIDTIKAIATGFITAATEGVVNSIIKNSGQK